MLQYLMPMLPTGGDVSTAVDYYKDLGFTVQFRDEGDTTAIMVRDGVHLMLTDIDDQHVAENTALRVRVDDADALYTEFDGKPGVGDIKDTPWGTRDFALIDPAGVCITFYHPLG